jgi:hypothetical protein
VGSSRPHTGAVGKVINSSKEHSMRGRISRSALILAIIMALLVILFVALGLYDAVFRP